MSILSRISRLEERLSVSLGDPRNSTVLVMPIKADEPYEAGTVLLMTFPGGQWQTIEPTDPRHAELCPPSDALRARQSDPEPAAIDRTTTASRTPQRAAEAILDEPNSPEAIRAMNRQRELEEKRRRDAEEAEWREERLWKWR